MFFAILYCGAGLYFALVSMGVLHPEYARKLDPGRRLGIRILAGGLLVLGSYYGFHAYFFASAAGKEYRELERRLQREAIEAPRR